MVPKPTHCGMMELPPIVRADLKGKEKGVCDQFTLFVNETASMVPYLHGTGQWLDTPITNVAFPL